MTFIVGLTGGIASGKSSVGRLFERHGAVVVDADALAHRLTGPGGGAMEAIAAEFGAGYVDAHGALDRSRMRDLAFRDPGARKRLEGILHPRIRIESDRAVAAAESPYVVLMIPLLVESGRPLERCRRIAVVDVPLAVQIDRMRARDGRSEEDARRVLAAQASRETRLAWADDVIDNGGPEAALAPQVARLHALYLALAGQAFGPRRHGEAR